MGNALLCQRYTLKPIKIHDEPEGDSSEQSTHVYFEEGELGAGGFSTVLLANRYSTDDESSKQVAVKRIACVDPDQLAAAAQEIELTKRISSPYVISLLSHGVCQSDVNPGHKIVSLVFPVYHGGTLWDFLIKREEEAKPLDSKHKLALAEGMLRGLKRCHALNIAHCDLKTANILLKADLKTPVLMDFGSASTQTLKTLDTHHSTQMLQDWAAEKCTACYRAPELFHVEYPAVVDLKKCDVWSMGSCLFALSYFHGPLDEIWMRGDSLALAVQSIEKYTSKLRDKTPEKDETIDELVDMCLKYNNAARASVDKILETLENRKT